VRPRPGAMVLAGGDIDCIGTMNLRRIIPSDMTASAVAHLSLLALLFLFSDVHPFGAVTTEAIAVDIVAPQDIPEKAEIEQKPEPVPTPQLEFTAVDKPAPEPVAQQPPSTRPQKQAALATPRPAPQPAAAPPPQPQAASAPAYRPPEPDVTQKYGVLLGLPLYIDPSPPTAATSSREKAGDNFDAAATQNADVASSVIAAFRRHLRTCSKLPATLKGSDDVRVKLRVYMGQDGKLAAEPVLIEASASMKGPLLMQSAISALQACQPYAMLPLDRYGEWKVLDLSFTPQDFSGS
jgi:outer membrane biosynthesis protein TonB